MTGSRSDAPGEQVSIPGNDTVCACLSLAVATTASFYIRLFVHYIVTVSRPSLHNQRRIAKINIHCTVRKDISSLPLCSAFKKRTSIGKLGISKL